MNLEYQMPRAINSGWHRSRSPRMCPRILLVSNDGRRLTVLLETLTDAGYLACGASSFAEGRQLLELESTDLIIADERLGPFNGLHLIVVGRSHHPMMKAIVMSHAQDAALENEAKQLNVGFQVQPAEPSGWISMISSTLEPAPDVIH